ncbi:nuclear ubiquitous casein and cyclin-dependent kinase substrate 1-like [Ranitomeya imitator]|uniref:nuclear ubiquitous casein and cyclin-dependent kinase substrate 1-like n=1 Tax=Ranitomeya imitator TaxID=111125 RepID=UPI0037E93AF3
MLEKYVRLPTAAVSRLFNRQDMKTRTYFLSMPKILDTQAENALSEHVRSSLLSSQQDEVPTQLQLNGAGYSDQVYADDQSRTLHLMTAPPWHSPHALLSGSKREVKDEDKPLSKKKNGSQNGASENSENEGEQPLSSPSSPMNSFSQNPLRAKSPEPRQSPLRVKSPERVPGSVRVTSPEPVQNGEEKSANDMQRAGREKSITTDTGSEEVGTKKKVVKVVRKMVRKVIPQEDTGSKNSPVQLQENSELPSPIPKAPAVPKAEAKKEKDDISVGLTSLMNRSKTKEHRQRFKLPEKKAEPAVEKVASSTPPAEKANQKSISTNLPASAEEKIVTMPPKAISPDLSNKMPQKPSRGFTPEVCTCIYVCA